MAQKLDKILVVDIEATCWDGPNPAGMENDIIEVGICLLDIHTGEITNNRGIIVKPERSVVSPFCTQLTTITPEMVDEEGISFKEACHPKKRIPVAKPCVGKFWRLRPKAVPKAMYSFRHRIPIWSISH